ncbi:transglutaminase-like domain-containing protein [Cellvibrio japonicus]|nr:transglutaminase domain-containing protein [Cellvibrio japonicus]QEI11601.1 sugar-binding protein [Cellvibrio japonicus]QEI15175.1 sugar-binding protein [Cellvibrio japonicus]QEI18755.1 sugar-binding protein [Cellvibrio japonicus]
MTQGIQTITMDSFRGGFFTRAIATLTLFFFTFVFYANPVAAAVANELNNEDQREAALEAAIETTPEKKLSHRLAKLRDKIVLELPQAIAQRDAEQNWFQRAFASIFSDGPLTSSELTELQSLKASIDDAYQEAITAFETEAAQFEQDATAAGNELSADVKQLIQSRHAEALEHIKNRYAQTQQQLTVLINAQSASAQEQALEQLNQSLEQEQFKPTHTPATPDSLPWKAPDESVREPVDNPQDLQVNLGINPYAKYAQLAQAGDTDPGLIAQAMANAANAELQAALTENIEVQLTPEIRALAAELNNNSIEIYTWVHNNIRYIPSHGSIQGAQHTLETKQGNAIDTASLLIALLRAANIPARYAYGTVEMPAEKVMNWVGGAQVPEAAQGILGMGGVPTIGIIEGGKIAKFKLEHVWVEAYVDYFPSRGMVEKVGDSWIPMDASFKQYDFTEGMNVAEQMPFDTEALVNTIQNKAIVNEEEGWIQSVPHADIEIQFAQFQEQLKSYIENQNPEATLGDVLGLQKIKILPPRPLAAGLPYNRIITSQTFSEVPNNLRHKFKYTLATENYGYSDSPFITIEEPTVKLAGKTLALSFKPTAKSDEDIIKAAIPTPDENGSVDPKKLPKTLPGYLINMTAEFTVNGEVVHSGVAGKMGGELYETMGLWSPKDSWESSVNHPIIGEYRAIGLNLQGIATHQVAKLKQDLENVKNKLQGSDADQLNSISRHELLGNLLFGTVLNYFALNDLQDRLAAQNSNMLTYRLPSYGTFSTVVSPQYWFGIPRNVGVGGLNMDIDHVKQHRVSKSNNNLDAITFSKNVGSRWSAMEHLVPEQMFGAESNNVQGVSAIKALTVASNQGQKIWTISKSNLGIALNRININAAAKNDIRNAVNAGKIATVHEGRVSVGNWIGEGYTLIDPKTGAGAYMISGGANGGFLSDEWSSYLTIGGLLIGVAGLLFTAPLLIFASAIISLVLALDGFLKFEEQIEGTKCENSGALELYAGLVIGAAILGFLLAGLAGFAILAWIGFLGGGAIAGSFLPKKGICT